MPLLGLLSNWHAGTGLQRNYGEVLLHDPDVAARLVDPLVSGTFILTLICGNERFPTSVTNIFRSVAESIVN